jgi:hypothetical protein
VNKLALIAIAALAVGCDDSKNGTASTPSSAKPSAATPASGAPTSSASSSIAIVDPPPFAAPFNAEQVARAVNPRGDKKYDGPTATVHGVVRIEGDAPTEVSLSVPSKCGEAAATYGKLFRVGQDKALADALVTVNFEKHYVPATEEAKKVTVHGCAFSTRTIAMTYGQRLEVSNTETGMETYMPYLDGIATKVALVAAPGGDPVKLYPTVPLAHYVLRDNMARTFMAADVFVLSFSTHAVTGLDGKFEIKRVPVGKVRVTAFLPSINQDVGKDVEVKEGDNVVDFTMTFDKSNPSGKPSASAAPSASAGPAPSSRPAPPTGATPPRPPTPPTKK